MHTDFNQVFQRPRNNEGTPFPHFCSALTRRPKNRKEKNGIAGVPEQAYKMSGKDPARSLELAGHPDLLQNLRASGSHWSLHHHFGNGPLRVTS